jgi:iron complex outermembrane recepter protein
MHRGHPIAHRPPAVRRRWRAAGAALTVAILTAPPGVCAGATAPDEESSAQAAHLQEVVVVARRREERLEDTPLAISVRSGEQLREDLAVLLEDVGRDVPNVRMVSSPQSVSALMSPCVARP